MRCDSEVTLLTVISVHVKERRGKRRSFLISAGNSATSRLHLLLFHWPQDQCEDSYKYRSTSTGVRDSTTTHVYVVRGKAKTAGSQRSKIQEGKKQGPRPAQGRLQSRRRLFWLLGGLAGSARPNCLLGFGIQANHIGPGSRTTSNRTSLRNPA